MQRLSYKGRYTRAQAFHNPQRAGATRQETDAHLVPAVPSSTLYEEIRMRLSTLCTILTLVVFVSASLTGQTRDSSGSLTKEMLGQLTGVGDKWVKLLEATPEDKLDWRPENERRGME